MKKFKDFIYDKNDVLIALLILILAALIIIWRMNAIMDYPQTLFQDTDTQPSAGNTAGIVTEDPTSDIQNEGQEQNDSQEPDDTAAGETSDPPQTSSLWNGDVLAKDIEVNVEGSVASSAVACLIEAGLFEDYEEYQAVCDAAGLDDEKVSAGLFEFKKGYTKADIAAEINWG